MNSPPQFPELFSALWGFDPFPWQTMLADVVAGGRWPAALDLPTASGKTACIDVALFALAMQADQAVEKRTAPRRVWFVVDRRIVVDEAFDRAQTIVAKLAAAKDGPLRDIADRLRKLAGTDRPVAVARLRGGVFRDDGWARLPSQAAVITSTVDQLGSRLLFRGYGRSHLTAPIFAGLAANDSVVLLDEAHCSVPFLQTLRAVERYRGNGWAEAPLPSPFAFVVMSATPPPDIPNDKIFPGADRDKALDHDVLRKRLGANKRAELAKVAAKKPAKSTSDDPLVQEAADRARRFVDSEVRRVGVMLNRVATAGRIAEVLRDDAGERYDVVLLTGRLRSYERDQIVERWKPFLKAGEPADPPKPIIMVTTQCLEVGADFSFDALVTEAASLDALRQRFGRLDRMGTAKTSSAVILIRDRDADPEKAEADPVYGHALAETWKLLTDKAGGGSIIDFGVERLRETLEDIGDPQPYLAPTPDAPVLLPAHLDLLCQTAPTPHPDPDVQQYLHGIGRGAPEVHVVWRADLGDDDRMWVETVAMCRPVSGEMLAAPLWRVREWLSRGEPRDSTSDVEGVAAGAEDGHGDLRPCLLWRGCAKSKVARAPAEIVPGDVVVVPAAYGMEGLARSGGAEALGREQVDLWERALESAGRPAAVRLHRAVVEPWMKCEPLRRLVEFAEAPSVERGDIRGAIDAVLGYTPAAEEDAPAPPSWWRDILSATRTGRIERHPAGGLVLFARAAKAKSSEPDLFADDDDLTCVRSAAQSLEEHTRLVRQTVEKLAVRCLPDTLHQVTADAAYWHDCGKLDERFQTLLNHGDELAALGAKQSLAKSALIPASPGERRALREASGLPDSFRHEMLSTHLADVHAAKPDMPPLADLFLHLIASHHGHARPLAPVIDDPESPSVEGNLGAQALSLSAEDRRRWIAHRVDSGLADRFWGLTRRYGWWGLAYLEAILRLGDWYASDLRVTSSSGSEEAQS
jgi:CRISPR-associated endonuclease/helicase Cas3